MSSSKVQPRVRGKNINVLNPQQQVFVSELLAMESFNYVEAARKAKYRNPAAASRRLMKNKVITSALGAALKKRKDKLELTAEMVLKELVNIGFSNPQKMFDKRGTLLNIADMPEEMARAISGFDVETRTEWEVNDDGKKVPVPITVTKVKLWNKPQALELIAKHLGMLDERLKVEHGVEDGTKNLIANLLARLEGKSNVIDGEVVERKLLGDK